MKQYIQLEKAINQVDCNLFSPHPPYLKSNMKTTFRGGGRILKSLWPEEGHFLGYLKGTGGGYPVFNNYYRSLGKPILVALSGGAPYGKESRKAAMKSVKLR